MGTGADGLIESLSGIRGIPYADLTLVDACRFAVNFARSVESDEILVARDSRRTGPAIVRAVTAGMIASGVTVLDYGIVSTPALFRESLLSGLPAVMVTASHNEPEFNGLKFLVGGKGVGKEVFDAIVSKGGGGKAPLRRGTMKPAPRPVYSDDLVARFGFGSAEGVKVALDLGGGAAISHAPGILKKMGCRVMSANDTYGVFNRKVDPVADDLQLLRELVKEGDCDVGLGFDCDGDRLVIVDPSGRKGTGDYMLTLALAELLRETGEKKLVVSVDTTVAVDELASNVGAQVFRSKVGEASVVGRMDEVGARLGGEGSSGGLIDGAFNYCRDSMLAALVIIRALKRKGRRFYQSVPMYHQERIVVRIPKPKASKGIKKLAASHEQADLTDGVRLVLSKRSWVLARPSGTEDVVRVSAEAETSLKAKRLAAAYAKKLLELSG
jgi:phosphomannomutase / phosphoglucomutase